MIRNCLVATMLTVASTANAKASSPLVGTWSEVDGRGMARIDSCETQKSALCATGLSRNRAGQIVEVGLVVSDIRPDGKNRWSGTYHQGKRRLPATIYLIDGRQVKLTVCIAMICQTANYTRTK
jgi:uncharacterized protein (DUF2147 family)